MKRKIALYIADQLVDLDDQSFILFNYTMEDMNNPTIVRNSFSQSITIKGTPNNNKIFGVLFRFDRVTQYGDSGKGVDFNPIRKTPFAIYNEFNEILESGYVKIDSVDRSKGEIEYKITLYGGLGSFFYSLMYKENGDKKSLGDIRYKTLSGGYTTIPGAFGVAGGYNMLSDAWSFLNNPQEYDYSEHDNWHCNIVNFMPCYNGIPDNFSADKILVDKDSYGNLPSLFPKSDAYSNLMLLSNPHTEWEIKDLRWYLQRPVISIKAIFDAICDKENNGGYDVVLDDSFFNPSNHLYWDAWLTMPLIPAEERTNADAVVNLLASMSSPAEYIISFAKMFGLVFLYDKNKTITIMPRKRFFKSDVMTDLTDRINVDSIFKSPVLAASRFYQYGGECVGEWAASYKKDYGLDYAIHKVNTGNEFNSDKTIVTNGILFKDAVEVQERNLLYVSSYDRNDVNGNGIDLLRLPLYESANLQQWKIVDGQEEMSEEIVTLPYEGFVFFQNKDYPLSDWLPKLQFHDADNKSADGANVLVVFAGMKTTPEWTSWAQLEYRLTDDIPDMSVLNEGVPCWNHTSRNSRKITSLPSFRRCYTKYEDGYDVIQSTFEWGIPKARGVNGVAHKAENPATLYNAWWRDYQRDRYDDDTYSITCKVDLKGLSAGQELMRGFFYYQGAIFVLNKIINHSLTTWDDTECEFVKVQDKSNYLK